MDVPDRRRSAGEPSLSGGSLCCGGDSCRGWRSGPAPVPSGAYETNQRKVRLTPWAF